MEEPEQTSDPIFDLPRYIDVCIECQAITRTRKDYHRGESFCENCGSVNSKIFVSKVVRGESEEYTIPIRVNEVIHPITGEVVRNSPDYHNFLSKLNNAEDKEFRAMIQCDEEELCTEVNSFKKRRHPWTGEIIKEPTKFRRIERLCNIYDRTHHNDKKSWRKKRYIEFVGVMNTNFMMGTQQGEAIEIINKLDEIKDLCKNCSYEQIIASICVMVMISHKRRINVDKNPFLKELGLTSKKYTGIMQKLAVNNFK